MPTGRCQLHSQPVLWCRGGESGWLAHLPPNAQPLRPAGWQVLSRGAADGRASSHQQRQLSLAVLLGSRQVVECSGWRLQLWKIRELMNDLWLAHAHACDCSLPQQKCQSCAACNTPCLTQKQLKYPTRVQTCCAARRWAPSTSRSASPCPPLKHAGRWASPAARVSTSSRLDGACLLYVSQTAGSCIGELQRLMDAGRADGCRCLVGWLVVGQLAH